MSLLATETISFVQLDSKQFAAGMFEAELTGEKYPAALRDYARAYLNVDTEGKGCVLLCAASGVGWGA